MPSSSPKRFSLAPAVGVLAAAIIASSSALAQFVDCRVTGAVDAWHYECGAQPTAPCEVWFNSTRFSVVERSGERHFQRPLTKATIHITLTAAPNIFFRMPSYARVAPTTRAGARLAVSVEADGKELWRTLSRESYWDQAVTSWRMPASDAEKLIAAMAKASAGRLSMWGENGEPLLGLGFPLQGLGPAMDTAFKRRAAIRSELAAGKQCIDFD